MCPTSHGALTARLSYHEPEGASRHVASPAAVRIPRRESSVSEIGRWRPAVMRDRHSEWYQKMMVRNAEQGETSAPVVSGDRDTAVCPASHSLVCNWPKRTTSRSVLSRAPIGAN